MNKAPRRRGKTDASSSAVLVEAATKLLASEGVAAVAARRVAQTAGLSHQIVHYYFASMDGLLIAVVRRGMDEAISELEKAANGPNSIAVMLAQNMSPLAVVMGTELTIHARDRPDLKAVINDAIIRYRSVQTKLLERHFHERGGGVMPPAVATVVLTSILRIFSLENGVGVSTGHRETFDWLAAQLILPGLADALLDRRPATPL